MEKKYSIKISEEGAGSRLDAFLAENLDQYSRAFFQKLIKNGDVVVNGNTVKPHQKLANEDLVKINIPEKIVKVLRAQDIPIKIVFENDDIAIVEKPTGMVVHPSDDGQNYTGTLVNALLHKFGQDKLSNMGGKLRPGIVHRLDKDTTGIMIVAKNNEIHEYLVDLLKNRKIEKTYKALVAGRIPHDGGMIDAPLERSRADYKKVVIANEGEGKEALTEFAIDQILETDTNSYTLLDVKIITGRTHQIRVHFKSIGYPVAGDLTYGNKNINAEMEKKGLKRQFLHAMNLKFTMPDGEIIDVKTKLPDDLQVVLDNFEK